MTIDDFCNPNLRIFYQPLGRGNCLDHAKRLLGLAMSGETISVNTRLVQAFTEYVYGGFHSWIEVEDKVLDLTSGFDWQDKDEYYRIVKPIRVKRYTVMELAKKTLETTCLEFWDLDG